MTANSAAKTEWTPADIPSLTGYNIIITGANSGIGYQAALVLAAKGAQVTLACRDKLKGNAALQAIRQSVPDARLVLGHLDLGSLSSVKRFAESVLSQCVPLHCLINNAGVMTPPRRLETAEGFELQFGTNVLGHFALTALLMPALQNAISANTVDAPRIVTLASIAHKRGRINFDNLQSEHGYSPMAAYAQSKLADLMFALELNRRLRAAGTDILSVAAHPGVASTNLFKTGDYHGIERAVRNAMGPLIGLALNTDAAGALPTLYAATADAVEGGGYYGPQGLLEVRGKHVGKAQIADQALDVTVAKHLWQVCEDLTGVPFPVGDQTN